MRWSRLRSGVEGVFVLVCNTLNVTVGGYKLGAGKSRDNVCS